MDSKIRNQTIEWVSKHLGDSFVFRKHQLETIEDIISNKLNNSNTKIVSFTPNNNSMILLI